MVALIALTTLRQGRTWQRRYRPKRQSDWSGSRHRVEE